MSLQVYDGLRLLQEAESTATKGDFDRASIMAQIFSGALFTAVVIYLMFSNSTRLSYIQRASLEKRLQVCANLSTIVASISAFMNFFQLTEVDNWALPSTNSEYVVDVCRPLEWILTCPVMQLILVILGGSKIPEYRRNLMPLSSALVLTFGSLSLFVDKPYTYAMYICGLCCHTVAMYFNRLQIVEVSRGMEGLLVGDSEFRKATIILMATWFPFPIWYILSPEGIGIITGVTVIQMGWACLNITAKFSLIFYIQRMKDNYCNRLKVKREMKGAQDAQMADEDSDDEFVVDIRLTGELMATVVETMNYLGMAENGERFVKLLRQAKIRSLDDVMTLDEDKCKTLQLPYDLIAALQKRHEVRRLEMVDDAEKGLEAGERYYMVVPDKKKAALEDDHNKKGSKNKERRPSDNSINPQGTQFFQPGPPSPWMSQNPNGVPPPLGQPPAMGQMGQTPMFGQNGMSQPPMSGQTMASPMPMVGSGFGGNGMPGNGFGGNVTPGNANPFSGFMDFSKPLDQDAMSDSGFDGKFSMPRPQSATPFQAQAMPFQSMPMQEQNQKELRKKISEDTEEKLEKFAEKFENKMMDRMELLVQGLGKQLEKNAEQMEKQAEKKARQQQERMDAQQMMQSSNATQQQVNSNMQNMQNYNQNLERSITDMRSTMERSQSMLEAKVEHVFNTQVKEQRSNVQQDLKEEMERQMESMFDRFQQQMSKRNGTNVASSNSSTVSVEYVQSSFDILTKKVEKLEDMQKQMIESVEKKVAIMVDGLAQNNIQEIKAAAYSTQSRIGQIEEVVSKKQGELEDRMTSKFEKMFTQNMDSFRNTMEKNNQAGKLQDLVEGLKTVHLNESKQLDQKLHKLNKDISQDVSKSVETAIGVVSNSLRSQLEGLQATQRASGMDTVSGVSSKIEGSLQKFSDSLRHMDGSGGQTDENTMRMLEKISDRVSLLQERSQSVSSPNGGGGSSRDAQEAAKGLRDLQRFMEDATRSQQANQQDMQSALVSVRNNTCECVDKLVVIGESMGIGRRGSMADSGSMGNSKFANLGRSAMSR